MFFFLVLSFTNPGEAIFLIPMVDSPQPQTALCAHACSYGHMSTLCPETDQWTMSRPLPDPPMTASQPLNLHPTMMHLDGQPNIPPAIMYRDTTAMAAWCRHLEMSAVSRYLIAPTLIPVTYHSRGRVTICQGKTSWGFSLTCCTHYIQKHGGEKLGVNDWPNVLRP